MVRRDNIPCWYELSWKEKVGIVLRIHQDFVTNTKPIPKDASILKQFKKHFGFKKFGTEFGKDFGFENSLRFLGQSESFLEYHVPASVCRKFTDENCRQCNGTGKREWDEDGKCFFCHGEGKETSYDYKEAFAVSASLTTLFLYMKFPETETSAILPQLLCVETITEAQSHGGSLYGEYSGDTVTFLRNRNPSPIPEMVTAMRETWEMMDGKLHSSYDFSFNAYTQSNQGWLNVNCPGDACGLHAGHNSVGIYPGYEFSCHNVDQPIQQMTLLASLAMLHNLVRSAPDT